MFRAQLAAALAVAIMVMNGCAASCPVGSTRKGAAWPKGSAQWCQRPGVSSTTVEAKQPKNEVLGVYQPQAQGRRIVGSYMDWHRNGHLRAHGRFDLRGGQTVASGVWTFWTDDGKRAVQGRYVAGYVVGCFAVWTDGGERLTFTARAGRLSKAKCTPPGSATASRLAERYRRARLGQRVPERFSAGVGVVASPNAIPVDAAALMQPRAAASQGLRLAFRRKLKRPAVGVVLSMVRTDEVRTWSASAAALGSLSLLPNHKQFDLELSGELGVRLYSVLPHLDATMVGLTSERFVTLYSGVQFAAGYRLSDHLSIYAALLAQHDLPRNIRRLSRYCVGCPSIESSWDVGGGFVGAMLQLRVLVN